MVWTLLSQSAGERRRQGRLRGGNQEVPVALFDIVPQASLLTGWRGRVFPTISVPILQRTHCVLNRYSSIWMGVREARKYSRQSV